MRQTGETVRRDGNRRDRRGGPQKVQFDTKSTLLRPANNPAENNARFHSNFHRIASVFPSRWLSSVFRRSTLFLPACRTVLQASCLST